MPFFFFGWSAATSNSLRVPKTKPSETSVQDADQFGNISLARSLGLLAELDRHVGNTPQHDDITCLLLKRT